MSLFLFSCCDPNPQAVDCDKSPSKKVAPPLDPLTPRILYAVIHKQHNETEFLRGINGQMRSPRVAAAGESHLILDNPTHPGATREWVASGSPKGGTLSIVLVLVLSAAVLVIDFFNFPKPPITSTAAPQSGISATPQPRSESGISASLRHAAEHEHDALNRPKHPSGGNVTQGNRK